MTPARRAMLAPAVLLFGIMLAHALLETARDALFLAHLGPHRLASAYLTIAIVAMAAVTVVRRWGGVRDPRRLLLLFLGVAVVGTSLLAVAIPRVPSLVFVLYVWTGLVATLVVPSFWTLVDRSLRVAEAKRMFAAIGAGGVLGAMIGSAVASLIGRYLAASDLVTAGALAFALTTASSFLLAPRAVGDELPRARQRTEALSRSSRRYVRLLIVVGVVSTVTLTIADLTFKRVLAERLPAEQLATTFGAIYMVLNMLGLIIQLVVTPRLLVRWGVASALTVLPILMVVTASGFALTGALVAILALKLGDGGLRHSLHRVASEILYLPVPAVVRDGWKPVADAVSQRGGQALAALLTFALASLTSSAQLLGAAVAVAGIAWLVVIHVARRAYVAQFRDTLRAGDIERDVRVPALDGDAAQLLVESLAAPDEVEALAALELLARGGRLPALVLYHPRETVVRRALALLERDLRPDVTRVLAHLVQHSDSKIRAAALAAASRTGSSRSLLDGALVDPDPDVRAVALVGLCEEPESEVRAWDGIVKLVAGTSSDRLALAHAIGYAPHERFRHTLYTLLATREPPVMREVLRVLARAPELADLDRLLALLEDPHVRGDVRAVFAAAGMRGLDRLIAALDDPRTPIGVRRHIPRTISRYRTRTAVAALVARLSREPDGTTEFKILRALGRLRADDPAIPVDTNVLLEYVRRAVGDAVRYTVFRDRLHETSACHSAGAELIDELLGEKRRWAIEHAFRALGIVYPHDGMRAAHDAMLGTSEPRRSAAREILEAVVPADVRGPLFALLDDLTPEQRRSRLGDRAPGPFPSDEALFAALLADPSESLKCVVAHHVAERHLVTLRHDLTRLRPLVGPPLVIYAFDQAIARMNDLHPQGLRRMLRLRQFPVFDAADLDELATIAGNVVETTIPAGTVVASAGARLHRIYLIVDGVIATRPVGMSWRQRQVYGALEVLADREVMHTAVAETDVHALELSSTDIGELLEDNYGVLLAGIRELAGRLVAAPVTSRAALVTRHQGHLGLVERLILLRQQLPFSGARLQALASLAHASEELTFPAGATLVRAGDVATSAFIVIDGSLAAEQDATTRGLEAGAAFGHLETLAGLPHRATISTTQPVRVLRSGAPAILDVLEDHTDVGLAMMAAFAGALLDAAPRLN